MVSDKSLENLAKGRKKGIRRKPAKRQDNNNTFAAIFHFIESLPVSDKEWELLGNLGITRENVAAAGITDERKLKKCVNMFLDDSPQAVRDYMQRSEPQDETLNVNLAVKG